MLKKKQTFRMFQLLSPGLYLEMSSGEKYRVVGEVVENTVPPKHDFTMMDPEDFGFIYLRKVK